MYILRRFEDLNEYKELSENLKMKVTFCTYDRENYVGGPNAGLLRLLPELGSRGVKPRVLFIVHSSPGRCATVRALKEAGIEHDCLYHRSAPYTGDRVRWILERLAENPPDVFVPNKVVPACFAARWAKEAGIPSVGVLRSDEDFYYGLLEEFVFGEREFRLSSLVCVSEYLERHVLSACPEGLEVRRIPSGTTVPEACAGPPGNTFRLVYTGRLDESQKRVSDVARAFCRAAGDVPGIEARIYGAGPSSSRVRKILRTDGRGLPVYFHGRVDSSEIQNHLIQNHAIALLSDYEGLPVSLMEAMACGLVPVCTRVRSGIPELVEDGVTGLLVDDRGEGFVRAVKRLKEEAGLWQKLSAAAKKKIEDGYTVGICAERWIELFGKLIPGERKLPNIQIPGNMPLPPVNALLSIEDRRRPPAFLIPYRKANRVWVKIKGRITGYGR